MIVLKGVLQQKLKDFLVSSVVFIWSRVYPTLHLTRHNITHRALNAHNLNSDG